MEGVQLLDTLLECAVVFMAPKLGTIRLELCACNCNWLLGKLELELELELPDVCLLWKLGMVKLDVACLLCE